MKDKPTGTTNLLSIYPILCILIKVYYHQVIWHVTDVRGRPLCYHSGPFTHIKSQVWSCDNQFNQGHECINQCVMLTAVFGMWECTGAMDEGKNSQTKCFFSLRWLIQPGAAGESDVMSKKTLIDEEVTVLYEKSSRHMTQLERKNEVMKCVRTWDACMDKKECGV